MNLYEEIKKVAHDLYEKSGRIGGRDFENWLEAEKIVLAGKKAAPAKKKTAEAKAPDKTAVKKTATKATAKTKKK
ncbi:MAG: DUF2934 domain-containing protein [Nitrospirae bacterium]|nr:DUF2934 domain-containing protein [Nitrospirota bacterium]